MNEMQRGILPLAFVAFLAREAAAQEDPGVLGPLDVTVSEYQGDPVETGDPPFVVEFLAQVHRPTNLVGRYPLVLFFHGQHATCYVVATPSVENYNWPCTSAGLTIRRSYRGYEYVAETLASHGMIVASISANGINAADNNLGGAPRFTERRELLERHISEWVKADATGNGYIGNTFVGKVDLSRIATVGHSRGGATVLSHASEGAPSGLRAVLAIAPTGDGLATPLSNLPLGVLLGYCDGDQYNLQGVGYVDEARYAVAADNTNKYTFLSLGANHNYFNSHWGNDDWNGSTDPHCGSSARLSATEQRGFGRAYIVAFLRKHLLGETQFDSILNGDALPPPSAETDDVFIGYLPGASDRKELNRLLTSSESTTNTLGGAVSTTGLSATPCGNSPRCVSANRVTHWPSSGGLPGTRIEWTAKNGVYSNALPLFKRDVSNFSTLQFRVAIDYTDTDNVVGAAQDFSISLTDSNGGSSTVTASDYSDVLYYPPGLVGVGSSNNRAAVMNTLRLPLEAFANVDLTSVEFVNLVFDKTDKGRVVLSDIAFTEEGSTAAEKWLASANGPF